MAGPILCSPARTETEAEVLARLLSGSPEAFDEIYRRYARYGAAIGFRLLGDYSELDDLVQDTFIEVANGIGILHDPSLFKSWLGTIAVRGVSRRRGRRRRTRFIHHTLSVFGITRSDPRTREPVDELYDWLDRVPERSR